MLSVACHHCFSIHGRRYFLEYRGIILVSLLPLRHREFVDQVSTLRDLVLEFLLIQLFKHLYLLLLDRLQVIILRTFLIILY